MAWRVTGGLHPELSRVRVKFNFNDELAMQAKGAAVPLVSAWGSTETSCVEALFSTGHPALITLRTSFCQALQWSPADSIKRREE
jgi:hypothetical protein